MIAIPIALAVAGAAASAKQASDQNKAIKRSMQASRDAAAVQDGQIIDQGEVEAMKRRNEAAMIRARLRVAGAEAGTGDGGTSLMTQAAYDEALNQNLIDRNVINERRRLSSGLQADLTALRGRAVNGILAAFQGGLQGASTGLQISSAVNSFNNIPPADSGQPLGIIGGSGVRNPDINVYPAYSGAFA